MNEDLTLSVKTKGAEDAAAKIKAVNDRVADTGKQGESIGDKLGKAALAITAVGVGLTAYSLGATNSTIAYTKSVSAISRVTGESVTETSRLQYAFQRSGIAADQTTQVFGIFSKKIVDANTNADRASTTLGKLNVATKNADGSTRSFSTVLFDVADKFKTMANGPEKTALAMDLFGRSGKNLIPILSKGADGIKELEAQADKLGITLTGKNVEAVAKYTEAQKKLKDSQTAFTLSVGQTALPMWQKLADFQVKAADTLRALPQPVQQAATAVLAFGGPVATAAGTILQFGSNLTDVSGKSIPQMLQKVPILGGALSALSSSFGSLGSLLANPVVLAIVAVVAAVALLLTYFHQWGPIVDGIRTSVQGFWASLMVVLKPAIDSIKASMIQLQPSFTAMVPVLQWLAQVIAVVLVAAIWVFVGVLAVVATAVTYTVAGIIAAFQWLSNMVGATFALIYAIFTGNWNMIIANLYNYVNTALAIFGGIRGVIGIFQAVFGWIVGFVAGQVNSVLRVIAGFVGIFSNSGEGLVNAFADGISRAFGRVKSVVSGGLSAVRKLLPFSDAKEGPLSDLTLSGRRFAETFATGIDKGAGAIDAAATGALSGLGGGMISPAVNGASRAGVGAQAGAGKQTANYFYGPMTFQNAEAVKEFFSQINANAELASLGVPTNG